MQKNGLPAFMLKYVKARSGPAPIGSRTRGTCRDGKKWVAYRMENGKKIHLGSFATQEEAFAASQRARGLSVPDK